VILLVAEGRRVARFVFRNYPEIQRKAMSAYQRARRQKAGDISDNGVVADR